MRVAFDVDGVLADMEEAVIRHASLLFGEPVGNAPVRWSDRRIPAGPTLGRSAASRTRRRAQALQGADEKLADLHRARLSLRQRPRFWRHIQSIQNFWESLHEIEPAAVARLASVAQERRWEVIFLTRRPVTAGDTTQLQTQRWLESKGFPLPTVYVVEDASRGRIASALGLDVVVDDRPAHCVDIAARSLARPILMWTATTAPPAAARRRDIEVVGSIDGCLDVLTARDAGIREPGLGRRLRQLLRLRR
jgi:hypothetical protein